MSDIQPTRLVLLPGALERKDEPQPTPEQAVGRVLAANVYAPGLLSEARYRVVLARNAVAAATQAARQFRDTELAYERARRGSDPHGSRSLPFWSAAGLLGILLVVTSVIVLTL